MKLEPDVVEDVDVETEKDVCRVLPGFRNDAASRGLTGSVAIVRVVELDPLGCNVRL